MARIVVIDDDRQLLDLLSLTLGRAGHEVLMVNRPQDGLGLLADESPDLLILDVMMPGMSGHDLCRRVKSDPALAELPILILTARNQEVDRQAALAAGADAYLAKPVTSGVETLLKTVYQAGVNADRVTLPRMVALLAENLAVNLAVALRALSEQPVGLIDFSPAGGQAAVHLRLKSDVTWADLTADLKNQALSDALVTHSSGVRLLAAPDGPVAADAPGASLADAILQAVRRMHLFTVVDLPAVLNNATTATLKQADLILHVVTPELIAIRQATHAQRILSAPAYRKAQQAIVLNHPIARAQLPRPTVERALQDKIAVEIGHDVEQGTALAAGRLLPLVPAASPLPAGMRRLASALWQQARHSGLAAQSYSTP